MRADQRPPRGGVAAAIVAQDGAIAVLGLERRPARRERLDLALKREPRPGKGRARRRARPRSAPRAGSRIRAAPRRPRRRARPPRARSRRARRRCARALFEQPVAPAQRPLELADARAMARVDRQHEAVEEPAPLARRTGKQRIHRRRQPDDPHMVARRRATRRPARGRCGSSARRRRRRPGSSRSRADGVSPSSSTSTDSAKPPAPPTRAHSASSARRRPRPGDEQRQRLEEIGLAGAVLAA